MHSNISITVGVYGILSDIDVQNQIERLGKGINSNNPSSRESLTKLLELLLQEINLPTDVN
jgi:hypothetical protein